MQYFINYNLDRGWYLGATPNVTADWKAPKGNQWVVPVGGGVGRICRLETVPLNIQAMQCSTPSRHLTLGRASSSLAAVPQEGARRQGSGLYTLISRRHVRVAKLDP